MDKQRTMRILSRVVAPAVAFEQPLTFIVQTMDSKVVHPRIPQAPNGPYMGKSPSYSTHRNSLDVVDNICRRRY